MILICGIPNAGKTTYSSRFDNVIHFDGLRGTMKQMFSSVVEMVSRNPDICVDGVYANACERKRLVAAASRSKNTCVWLDTPVDVCVSRENRNRPEELPAWTRQTFEPPTYEEGWDEIIVLKDNGIFD